MESPKPLSRPLTLLARTDFRVIYNKHPDTLRIYLQKRYRTDSAAYWQVIGTDPLPKMSGKKFITSKGIGNADTLRREFLPPNAHEVAFLPLLRGITETRSLLRFMPDRVKPTNNEQRLETIIHAGNLTIETSIRTIMYLDTGWGWVLQLEEFVREKANSGWLITDLFDTYTLSTLPTHIRTAVQPKKP
ncbi:hypothetical protein GCM10023189_10470 [Nibrella saemangeumensis]|uniref:SnoaL-like domain-containing protein n=2 Tax=Nibrella saemangeumensis TaxID=1084526 RepID=A0ABP8MJF9_9BACT